MAKKKPSKSAFKEKEIPLIWEFPHDIVSAYATNMLVQIGANEFYVSFFEMPPPIIMQPADLEDIEHIRAKCVARIIISPEKLPEFVGVLQKQLDLYNERKKSAASEEANGDK